MRIIKTEILSKNGRGYVKVQAEQPEDMWHLYNLIAEGDSIRSTTYRNVVRVSSTGAGEKTRMKTQLCIRVVKIEYDSEECPLRVSGQNIEENDHVKMGQYHTILLEVNQPVRIDKDRWDFIYLERLKEAKDPAAKADVAAIVMQEGLAHLCIVLPFLTLTKARIERRMPKKGQLNNGHPKAMNKFFEDIYDAIRKHLNFEVMRCVLVGSPGFLNDDFLKFLNQQAVRRGDSALIHNKSKFLKVHASSGRKRAIEEILLSEEVKSQLEDVKAVEEVRALERFHNMLSNDQDRAAYGYREVNYADENLAIDELLVTDKLFQAAVVEERIKYVALVESVQEHGGKVFIFSSMHVSGEQLDQYTGVAATLRFPLLQSQIEAGLKEDDSDSDSSSSDDDSLVLEALPSEMDKDCEVNNMRRRLSSADQSELEGFDIDLEGFI